MAESVERTLDRVATLGYREVEFAGWFGRSATQIRVALASAGLGSPASHVALETLEGDRLRPSADAAREAGHAWVIVAWLDPSERASLDAWRRMAQRFTDIGRRLSDYGLRFAYHNHAYEFAPLEGGVPWEVLVQATDPACVDLELDLFWCVRAGVDPRAVLAAHPGRYRLVHVKDSGGPPEHRQVDVGAGTIDFASFFAAPDAGAIRHAFVEHDEPADPWAFAATSLAGYRRIGG
ncbi:MAG: sugar phosphate isomerase/epimerase family protein [Gemmatimonadales bacterium]